MVLLVAALGFVVWIIVVVTSEGHRDWLRDDGTNLGGVVAAVIAAAVGVTGAYWAALRATEAGVTQADRLEMLRARRFVEHDQLTSSSAELRRLARRVSDRLNERLDQRSTDRPASAASVLEMYDIATEAEALVSGLGRLDPGVVKCWLVLHNVRDGIGWGADKVQRLDALRASNQVAPTRVRAAEYLQLTEEELELINPGSDWAEYAPPVDVADIQVFRFAEAMIDDALLQSLMHASSVTSMAAAQRLAPDFDPNRGSDVLGIGASPLARSEAESSSDDLAADIEKLLQKVRTKM
jgi:hypothetical protein